MLVEVSSPQQQQGHIPPKHHSLESAFIPTLKMVPLLVKSGLARYLIFFAAERTVHQKVIASPHWINDTLPSLPETNNEGFTLQKKKRPQCLPQIGLRNSSSNHWFVHWWSCCFRFRKEKFHVFSVTTKLSEWTLDGSIVGTDYCHVTLFLKMRYPPGN